MGLLNLEDKSLPNLCGFGSQQNNQTRHSIDIYFPYSFEEHTGINIRMSSQITTLQVIRDVLTREK